MELNELKKVWNSEQKKPKWDYSRSELLMLINNKMISLEKDVKSRDRLEIIACLLVAIFFSVMLFVTSSIWQQIGSVIIVVSSGFICYKLISSQKKYSPAEGSTPDKPLADYLKAELAFVKRQKKLLDNIIWWYILPMTTGILFYAAGFRLHWIYKLIYMAMVIVLGGIIWKLNHNAAARRFNPLLTKIRESLHFLEENE